MVIDSMLSYAEIGRNDHWKKGPHFTLSIRFRCNGSKTKWLNSFRQTILSKWKSKQCWMFFIFKRVWWPSPSYRIWMEAQFWRGFYSWTFMYINPCSYIIHEFKAQDVHPVDQDLCCPKKKNSNWLRFPGTSFGYTQYQNYHVVISCSGKLKIHWVHLTVDRLSKIRLPVIRWSLSLKFRFLILYITRVVYCTCFKSSTITLHSTFLINSRAVLDAWFVCCFSGLMHSNKSFLSNYLTFFLF